MLRVIPMGGVAEIGKNMTLIEQDGEILIIDCGLMFPEEEMLGVDIVINDFRYLIERADRVRGIILTHGHEDHIGALPYLLRDLNVPIWGTRLTIGLVDAKLAEWGLVDYTTKHVIEAGERVEIGPFAIDTMHVSHSIPDGIGLGIHTKYGIIVHTGDYKLDPTPVDGRMTDFAGFERLGDQGVLLLITDTTNVERPGHVPSERIVGQTFHDVFARAERRVIIATFASNIHRIQQALDVSAHFGRRVAILGRSMAANTDIAAELGYLNVPEGIRIAVPEIDFLAGHQVTILTTGSQGEPMSALSLMATEEHKKVQIQPGDTVIISATPIPGNEDLVHRTINHLFRLGADVVYHPLAPVHVSGHAYQDEQKLMYSLVRPRYVIPFHGERRHIAHYAKVIQALGHPAERILRLEPGDILELDGDDARLAGRIDGGAIMVDGLGVGDVSHVVLRDRQHLSQDGILVAVITVDRATGKVVAGPEIVSRGFVYMQEAESLIEEAKQRIQAELAQAGETPPDWATIKMDVRASLSKFLFAITGRQPMIIPIIMEV
ncbi:MAG: ribonuclease J [Armatimonadetes bacterium]|jgi:ribonuclease J|nr:ribonuclease J [Armatimonadota bacterium]